MPGAARSGESQTHPYAGPSGGQDQRRVRVAFMQQILPAILRIVNVARDWVPKRPFVL